MKHTLLFGFLFLNVSLTLAQSNRYWQQHVDYKMDVTMDVKTFQYKGKQELIYTNNSLDTLRRLFYHL